MLCDIIALTISGNGVIISTFITNQAILQLFEQLLVNLALVGLAVLLGILMLTSLRGLSGIFGEFYQQIIYIISPAFS